MTQAFARLLRSMLRWAQALGGLGQLMQGRSRAFAWRLQRLRALSQAFARYRQPVLPCRRRREGTLVC
jgi:hypothetical protein